MFILGLLRVYDIIYAMSETTEPVIGQNPYEMTWWGRPSKLTDDQKREVYNAMVDYLNDTDDPTLADFVSTNDTAIGYNVTTQNIIDWQEFSLLRKRIITKQEAYLVREATQNKINPTVAIFRLKQPQHGYRDRQEITGAEGKDLIPAQELSPSQAAQLLTLRAERGDDPSTD